MNRSYPNKTLSFSLFFLSISSIFLYYMLPKLFLGIPHSESFYLTAIYSVGYTFANALLYNFLDKKHSWGARTLFRFLLSLIGIILVNTFITYALHFSYLVLYKGSSAEDILSLNRFNLLCIWGITIIALFYHGFDYLKSLKQRVERKLSQQKIIAHSADARYQSLKNQLDPHFLFNSLNVLSSLVEENPSQAQNFIHLLSKTYRYILEQKDKDLISVGDELSFAETYCQLLKMRFEESISLSFELEEGLKNHLIAPLSLQLLLENAIKHNYASVQSPLHIKIYSESDNFLVVENNFQPRKTNASKTGIGLQNIIQRYAILTDKPVQIERNTQHFKVKIPILTLKNKIMDKNFETKDQARRKAERKAAALTDFYGNLISYALIIPTLFLINWLTLPKYWWAVWPAIGWGLGLAIHAVKTLYITSNWEEKQVQKFLKEDEKLHPKH